MKVKTFLLGFLLFCSLHSVDIPEREMVIIIPSFNNAQWCQNNILSALDQKYNKFRILYINDGSTDDTSKIVAELANTHFPDSFCSVDFDNDSHDVPQLVREFSKQVNDERKSFTLVNNKNRKGATQNWYLAIHSCSDHEIVVSLDGDDWFPHNEVLKRLNEVYASGEVWMTHGTMIEFPSGHTGWCQPVPHSEVLNNTVRHCRCPSHLRTFYAGLYNKILLEDFLFHGHFLPVNCDMAMMFPMLEMAGERHAFIHEIIYVYNRSNPINDDKVNTYQQRELEGYIRGKKAYQPLSERPF